VVSGRGKSKGARAVWRPLSSAKRAGTWPSRCRTGPQNRWNPRFGLLHSRLPGKVFKTATTDWRKEFSCYSVLEKDLEIAFYFADPYSSWQRGSNENTNGLFREFFPKGTDFDKVTGGR
jgi:IS30 family transposase